VIANGNRNPSRTRQPGVALQFSAVQMRHQPRQTR